VIIASGMATFLAASLAGVVFVASSANTTWTPRLQASGQVRSFQQTFADDVALGALPSFTTTNPCPDVSPAPAPSDPIILRGLSQTNPSPPPVALAATQVAYWFDPASQLVQRCVAGKGSGVVARNVTAFAWRIDRTNGSAVVITITTTDAGVPPRYTETQTLRFVPHRDTP
jgi:hypothetical protein